MSLVKWEPFRDLWSLQHSINRLFDDTFPALKSVDRENPNQGWLFPVDIKDSDTAVVIKAELPGMKKEDINVTYENNILTVRGERKSEEREERSNYLRLERRQGFFSRSFSLDMQIDQEGIKAVYKDGVLEVNLPKKEPHRAKEVTIDIEG